MNDQELLDATLLASMNLLSQGKVQAARQLQRLLKDLPRLKEMVGEEAPEEPKRPKSSLPGRKP